MKSQSFRPAAATTQQAAMLCAYLRAHAKRIPSKFSVADAIAVLQELESCSSAPKDLAGALESMLLKRGVRLSHVLALELAAQLREQSPWLRVQLNRPRSETTLEVTDQSFKSVTVDSWPMAIDHLSAACERWLREHPTSKVLSISASSCVLGVLGLTFSGPGQRKTSAPDIDFVGHVKASDGNLGWLSTAFAPVERLRRKLEQSGLALLDGYAILRVLSERRPPWGTEVDLLTTNIADSGNAELVLRREDNPVALDGFEVARGGEVACWHQFERALDDESGPGPHGAPIIVDEEDGAWWCGSARFVWEVATIRDEQPIPAIIIHQLSCRHSKSLLQRYLLARRIIASPMPARDEARRLDIFSSPPEKCWLHAGRVVEQLNAAGSNWEVFCESTGLEPSPLSAPVSLGHFLLLAEYLGLDSPDLLLALPPRRELVAGSEHHLQMFMPRVDRLRYRAPRDLDADRAEQLRELMEEFQASIRLRRGFLQMETPLPQLVYANDSAELLAAIWGMGLQAHLGVIPHLMTLPQEIQDQLRRQREQLAKRAAEANQAFEVADFHRYALGRALVIDVDWSN